MNANVSKNCTSSASLSANVRTTCTTASTTTVAMTTGGILNIGSLGLVTRGHLRPAEIGRGVAIGKLVNKFQTAKTEREGLGTLPFCSLCGGFFRTTPPIAISCDRQMLPKRQALPKSAIASLGGAWAAPVTSPRLPL